MTDRCISINGKVFNVKTGHEWEFFYTGSSVKNSSQQIVALESLPFSIIQVGLLTDSEEGKNSALLFKFDPSTRKVCTLGQHRKDVQLFQLLNENLMLIKFREDDFRPDTNYWTMMSVQGQIQEIPEDLNKILTAQDWSSMIMKQIREPVDQEHVDMVKDRVNKYINNLRKKDGSEFTAS